ncbi:hypothetical protein [Hymenobacter lucidus]|uniref:Uncharacterized protein n=1 Tax=Hymenobacter lucidus TaxID=2880930 RepID=A0ABS8AK44_9BACT|nr:hypothetical protein [Hymenobacter lucidus]MCB2406572.1 hypothetical protein [Hymenobacter lucidus]
MKPLTNASPPLPAWIMVLVLSVGLNLYWLFSSYSATDPAPAPAATARLVSHRTAAVDDDDDDDNEEDDTSWLALSEELRQTRRQLAECQGRTSAATHRIVSQ